MRKIAVSKLPIDPGPSGWAHVSDAPPAARMIEAHETADWLIIGAGFAGLAAARRYRASGPGDGARIDRFDPVELYVPCAESGE